MTATPPGWTRCVLSDVGEIKGGLTLGKKRRPGEHVRDVPYLRVANVQRGKLDLAEIKVIAATEREIDELRLQPGDILMNEGGDRDKLGRGWVWSGEMPECIHQNHVFRVRVFDGVEPRFVSHYANSAGQSHFQSSGRQTTNLASVNKTTLSALSLPLPPSKEQRRIVAKLDAIFDQTRAAKSRLERLPALLEKLKRSILAAAFRGDLTKDWRAAHPNVEPADVLLDRIRSERRRRWEDGVRAQREDATRAQYEESVEPSRDGAGKLPRDWCWASVDQLSDLQLGQQRAPVHADAEVTHPYVRAANIKWGGLDLTTVKRMGFPNPQRYLLRFGDVLLNEASGSPTEVGKPAIWRDEIPGCCYQKTLLRARPRSSEVLSEWLHAAFLADALLGRFARMAPGVGILHLTADRMFAWPVPFAPLIEQREIVRRLDAAFAAIEQLTTKATSTFTRLDEAEKAVLSKGFRGELVPQDPADEPASALLERIRAASAAQQSTPRRGRAAPTGEATLTAAIRTNGHITTPRDAPLDLVIAAFHQGEPRLGATEIAEATGLDAAAVKRALAALVDTGQVRVHGRARGTTYEWSP